MTILSRPLPPAAGYREGARRRGVNLAVIPLVLIRSPASIVPSDGTVCAALPHTPSNPPNPRQPENNASLVSEAGEGKLAWK
ncbi:MAG: hypothetical protein ACSHX3_10550 [Litorimonas sp.]